MENSKSAKGMMIDAATVAEAGYKALKRGKVITVPGIKGKPLVILTRIAPRNLLTKLMRAMA